MTTSAPPTAASAMKPRKIHRAARLPGAASGTGTASTSAEGFAGLAVFAAFGSCGENWSELTTTWPHTLASWSGWSGTSWLVDNSIVESLSGRLTIARSSLT